jgi:hypothetical protein
MTSEALDKAGDQATWWSNETSGTTQQPMSRNPYLRSTAIL